MMRPNSFDLSNGSIPQWIFLAEHERFDGLFVRNLQR